jgi:enoyl-CoA hydratase/carnithine racemase
MGLVSSNDWQAFSSTYTGIRMSWLRLREALVISKASPGFDRAAVDQLSGLLREIAAGGHPKLKFLVFDFAFDGFDQGIAPEGFADMIDANAELIVDTPVITIAWTRALLGGLDFDFAMNCSAIVAETGARFSFAGEPFELFGLYAALGRRIGFAKTERLIESERTLSAEEARDLMLVKDVVAPQAGVAGIASYLAQFERRYNASHAIFRAQRMAEPPIDRRPVEAGLRR